jgi:hypothetical protein
MDERITYANGHVDLLSMLDHLTRNFTSTGLSKGRVSERAHSVRKIETNGGTDDKHSLVFEPIRPSIRPGMRDFTREMHIPLVEAVNRGNVWRVVAASGDDNSIIMLWQAFRFRKPDYVESHDQRGNIPSCSMWRGSC